MSILKTKKKGSTEVLKGLLEKIPAAQKKNWENHLIPHFIARTTEWLGHPMTETIERNRQCANFLINKKMMREFSLLRQCPFPQDFADALEWVLHAGDQIPETKAEMTDLVYIYQNFENIMKKNPCPKNKKK